MAGRSIVITGAARGVGAACARRFAANGDRLVLADKNEELGKQFAEELRANNPNVPVLTNEYGVNGNIFYEFMFYAYCRLP